MGKRAYGGQVHRDLRPLLEAARAAGWEERPCARGGVVVYPANGGRPIPLHNGVQPGTVRNVRSQMKRAGLDV
jgi:hypothetical protein